MIAHPLTLQGTAQAPARPQIPALPAAPGAATGAGGAGGVGGAGGAEAPPALPGPAQPVSAPEGRTSTSQPPYDPETIIQAAVPLFGIALSMVMVIFIGWPLARAFARRLDRRAELGTVRAADLQPQIRQLQESIDTMAVELERISEAQRFQAKLMAERPQALPSEHTRA